jgi:signal transduction histidine kinase
MIMLVGWSAATAWRDIGALRGRFTKAQFESFRVAGELQSSVLSLDSGLLAYEITGEQADWEHFQTKSHALDDWIDLQRGALKTEGEKRALDEINAEYDHYLAVAQTIHREHTEQSTPIRSRLQQIEAAAQRMLALGARLADAHRSALGDFLGESQRSLQRLEAILAAGCLAMLAAVTWGMRVLFRDTIAPLRTQLIETHALAERREKLASLGVLAAGVAHEIRNPLTALKTRAFTLRKKLDPDAPALEDATIIEDEIEHLDCIVSDFLLFARPGDPDLAEFTSNELLCEVRALLSPQLAKNEVELAVESTADETTLRADRQQLKQVLINLVRNAFENIGQKGRITLRSRQCHLPLHGRQQEVAVLEVEDTGSGIPTKVRGRLFDPFFTTKPAGTGLGLSIAMRILEQHGGTLQFKTALGRGTTFGVILPLPSPEPRVAPDQESTANITPALRIVKGSQIT